MDDPQNEYVDFYEILKAYAFVRDIPFDQQSKCDDGYRLTDEEFLRNCGIKND